MTIEFNNRKFKFIYWNANEWSQGNYFMIQIMVENGSWEYVAKHQEIGFTPKSYYFNPQDLHSNQEEYFRLCKEYIVKVYSY